MNYNANEIKIEWDALSCPSVVYLSPLLSMQTKEQRKKRKSMSVKINNKTRTQMNWSLDGETPFGKQTQTEPKRERNDETITWTKNEINEWANVSERLLTKKRNGMNVMERLIKQKYNQNTYDLSTKICCSSLNLKTIHRNIIEKLHFFMPFSYIVSTLLFTNT